jgi:hypothetical protein
MCSANSEDLPENMAEIIASQTNRFEFRIGYDISFFQNITVKSIINTAISLSS